MGLTQFSPKVDLLGFSRLQESCTAVFHIHQWPLQFPLRALSSSSYQEDETRCMDHRALAPYSQLILFKLLRVETHSRLHGMVYVYRAQSTHRSPHRMTSHLICMALTTNHKKLHISDFHLLFFAFTHNAGFQMHLENRRNYYSGVVLEAKNCFVYVW